MLRLVRRGEARTEVEVEARRVARRKVRRKVNILSGLIWVLGRVGFGDLETRWLTRCRSWLRQLLEHV